MSEGDWLAADARLRAGDGPESSAYLRLCLSDAEAEVDHLRAEAALQSRVADTTPGVVLEKLQRDEVPVPFGRLISQQVSSLDLNPDSSGLKRLAAQLTGAAESDPADPTAPLRALENLGDSQDQPTRAVVTKDSLLLQEPQPLSPDEIEAILKDHALWLKGKGGHQARLAWTDLRGAHLIGVDLTRADLRKANLHDADLAGANLFEADLFGADLRKANLTGANLHKSGLVRANLTGAYLRGANLHMANLEGADLSGADLEGADLSGADLTGAIGYKPV